MEAIFLSCGAGGPQLKRNPLGRCGLDPDPDMATIEFPENAGEALASTAGPEFEARLRAAGIALPEGTSGADILRAVLQGRLQNLSEEESAFFTKGQQFGLSPIMEICRALQTELPGGTADPAFRELLLHRVKAWAATKRHPGEAASA